MKLQSSNLERVMQWSDTNFIHIGFRANITMKNFPIVRYDFLLSFNGK